MATTHQSHAHAWIGFDQVRVPRSALLSGHCSVSESGEYTLVSKGIKPFEMIGQRLYTGRERATGLEPCDRAAGRSNHGSPPRPIRS